MQTAGTKFRAASFLLQIFAGGRNMVDDVFTASQNFRAAKAQLLAIETEFRRVSSDEAARAVEAAMQRFDAARLALRKATRTTLPTMWPVSVE